MKIVICAGLLLLMSEFVGCRRDERENTIIPIPELKTVPPLMSTEDKQPRAGDMVELVGLPPGFLDDLPVEEQTAISAMVGKPIKFCGIGSGIFHNTTWERVELEFMDEKRGMKHWLYVDSSFIQPVK